MSWKKGDPNHPWRKRAQANGNGDNSVAVLEPVNKVMPGYDLVLGLRKLRTGPFAGLWELTKLAVDPEHTEVLKVLSDANLKRFVMARAAREFGGLI